ncbi:hypothetical protein [Chryseobacterium artocarpi]|uniref:hypothetical protein n=1 Tax=Chryseobacterium artocarpi TaxID=1414727 RepID=UPI003F3C1D07
MYFFHIGNAVISNNNNITIKKPGKAPKTKYSEGCIGFDTTKANYIGHLMDYFSVRIDKMPELEGGVMQLYKLLKQNFLTLSAGSIDFKGHGAGPRSIDMTVNGLWKFRSYPKEDDPKYEKEQVRKWNSETGNPIFYIEAGSNDWYAEPIVDHGAVIVSEFSDTYWLFTTIYETQPFSGHRQFGIHQDEEGCYRIFTCTLDRVWPDESIIGSKNANFGNVNDTVKDYFTIANGT